MKLVVVSCCISLVFVGFSCPEDPPLPAAPQGFSMSDISVHTSSPTPKVGDTAWVAFSYTAKYTGPAQMMWEFNDVIAPFDAQSGERDRTFSINVSWEFFWKSIALIRHTTASSSETVVGKWT